MICNQLSTCIAQEHAGNINHLCVNRNRNDCIESADRRSKVKCEEKNKKYILDNTLNNFETCNYNKQDAISKKYEYKHNS